MIVKMKELSNTYQLAYISKYPNIFTTFQNTLYIEQKNVKFTNLENHG